MSRSEPLINAGELRETGFAQRQVSREAFLATVRRLGTPVAVRRGGPIIDRLRPLEPEAAAPRSLSATFGTGRFPFHTDAAHHRVPPRFVLLRVADDSVTTTPTELVDFDSFALSKADVEALRREPWLVRGGLGRTFFSAILSALGGNSVLRFDPGCMRPAAGINAAGHDILSDALAAAQKRRVDWQPGRMVVFDNWRFLHARPVVQPNDAGRTLERVLVTP